MSDVYATLNIPECATAGDVAQKVREDILPLIDDSEVREDFRDGGYDYIEQALEAFAKRCIERGYV